MEKRLYSYYLHDTSAHTKNGALFSKEVMMNINSYINRIVFLKDEVQVSYIPMIDFQNLSTCKKTVRRKIKKSIVIIGYYRFLY
jgi:hypothetical protein